MDAKIAVLPGDGIGPEVMEHALRVLDVISESSGHRFEYEHAPVGGCAIDTEGTALPDETLRLCRDSDAVLFGAVGGPKWDHVPTEERPERALARLRRELELFSNLRPIRGRKALAPVLPVRELVISEGLDFVVSRVLTAGIYYGEPRGIFGDGPERYGVDTLSYTAKQIEPALRVAFELAQQRRGKLTSVDKANMLESSRFWRETVDEVSGGYRDVEVEHMFVDACAWALIHNPSQFDVILTGTLFGDILSDEAGVLAGSLGMLPSASYGSGRSGLYEPIHGTAPDIAGQGIANPTAAILSAALMLRHSFGLEEDALAIERAVDAAIDDGYRTADIRQDGLGVVGTDEMADAIIVRL